jgi:hypothetical protein
MLMLPVDNFCAERNFSCAQLNSEQLVCNCKGNIKGFNSHLEAYLRSNRHLAPDSKANQH